MSVNQKTRKQKILKIVLIAVVLLVAVRLALPYAILKYANNTLATMPGYRGHVEDIDLALFRGAYQIDSIYLNKYDSVTQKETPFFGAKEIDLSLEWRSLFKGSIVGELMFIEPTLRFTAEKVEPNKIKKDSTDFKKLLEDFMPLKVNRFEVVDGNIQYIDETSKPKVDIAMTNTDIVATNLRNAYDSTESLLPSTIQANAEVYDGTLDFFMRLNPLAETPTFDMNAELKNTNLTKLNDFFKAYAKVDINKGTLGLYTEIAAKEGQFRGYVKPLLKNMDVLGEEDRKDNIFRKLWEGFVGVTGQVFENLKEDQVATKIPFKGEVKDPQANIWYTITYVLQNAFVRAMQPSLDHEINIAAIEAEKNKKEPFLERVFGKEDDKKIDEEDDKKKSRKERKEERKKRREEREERRRKDEKS
jgi:hypothetical protein